jgi:hypothetical protein
MEPDVFVGGEEPSELWTDDTDDISKHWDEDQTSIESEDKTGTTRGPDGESKSVQTCQPGIGELTVPSVTKEEEMEAVEDDVESQTLSDEEFSMEPRFTHRCTRLQLYMDLL